MRSLNIPAVSIDINGHSLTYLPTISNYVHGDHIADFVTVPSQDLLLNLSQVQDIIQKGTSGDLDMVIKDKYPYQYYFTNIELHRNENNLLLETNSVCSSIPTSDWNLMVNEVSEYNLKYNQKLCNISSDKLPIKTLSALS